ncbi:MAG TPA: response regulator [Gemmatimonadaceae bacterium]
MPDVDGRERARSLSGWADTLAAGHRVMGASAEHRFVKNRRVLVIDHYVDAAESLAAVLRFTGREVITAYHAGDAVRLAESFRPHVVTIGLRRLDRQATCRALRAHRWAQDIVILALSARGGEDDRRAAREAGFDGFLVKPANVAALIGFLDDLTPAPQ